MGTGHRSKLECRNTTPKVSPIVYEEENVIIRVFFHGDLVRPQVCPEEYTVIVVGGFMVLSSVKGWRTFAIDALGGTAIA